MKIKITHEGRDGVWITDEKEEINPYLLSGEELERTIEKRKRGE